MTEVYSRPARTIVEVIAQLGAAGTRLTEIEASEGAAGNLSVFLRGPLEAHPEFNQSEDVELPLVVPELAGCWFVVTGSGTRSREIRESPAACLGCLEIHAEGRTGRLWYSRHRRFSRLTSEFNSHLLVHRDHVVRGSLGYHAVAHAQPRKVTYLSHLQRYQDEATFNRRLLRWQPEAILNFPEGIGVVPFLVPSSRELMAATSTALGDRRMAVWSKHGVIARSSNSLISAVDLIEYLETAATYECLDRMVGGEGEGLSPEQMREICATYGVVQSIF